MPPFVRGQPQASPVNPYQAPIMIRHPDKFRRHEAEDLGDISPVLFFASMDPQNWYSIHEAISTSKQLGSRLGRHVLDPKEPLNSLEFRMETFNHAGWQGRAKEEMAEAGFYYDESTGSACCYVCRVKFRDMDDPDVCPWQRHAELAPHCCHLQRYYAHGHKTAASAKRRRFPSTSAVIDMTREPAHATDF